MSLMDDILSDDAVFGFLSDEFAEDVIWHDADGNTRTIKATIDRHPPLALNQVPGSVTPHLLVSVANDSTLGIAREEIDRGANVLELKYNLGDTTYTSLKIRVIERQDAGMLLLKVH